MENKDKEIEPAPPEVTLTELEGCFDSDMTDQIREVLEDRVLRLRDVDSAYEEILTVIVQYFPNEKKDNSSRAERFDTLVNKLYKVLEVIPFTTTQREDIAHYLREIIQHFNEANNHPHD